MRVDVHAHYVPPRVLEILDKNPGRYGAHMEESSQGGRCVCYNYGLTLRPFFPRLLDLDERWAEMDRQGVDRQVLSVWADLFGYGMPAEYGAPWNRLLNDRLCETVRNHSDRLSMLATVPLQDPHRAAQELEYGVKQCGAVGGVVAASVDGVNLGEASLDDFWSPAVELGVPIFIHPTQPIPAPRTLNPVLNVGVQYIYDTTVTVASLLFNGVLDRFADLNLILSHGGGFMPYQVGRFDRLYRNLEAQDAPAQTPSDYLRRFWYDTIVHMPPALSFLRELVGSDRLLLGTDYPFPVDDPDPLQIIREAGFPDDEVSQISGDNACRLFDL